MKDLPELVLLDDGTLDTVFKCHDCGATLRFQSECIDRDPEGMVTLEGYAYAQDVHAMEGTCSS